MKATPKIAMMSPTSVTRLFPRQHSRSVGKSVNDGQAVETFPQPLGKVPFPLLLRHTPRFRDLLRGHGRDQHVVNQGGPISPEFGPTRHRPASFDDLIGEVLELRWHIEADCRGTFEVDHEIKPLRTPDR
jgi:hypothetical protein